MKDVPTEIPGGLTIAAICKREDVRDALLSSAGATLESLPKGARVGTSSLRRQSQLLHARSDLRMMELRGNVDTRIEKLKRGDYDAIVLAKAGLDRLGLSANITQVLPQEICLPAAGQGAIGIEARAGDRETLRVLAPLNDAETRCACDSRARRAGRTRRRLPGFHWRLGTRRKWKTGSRCGRAVSRRRATHVGKRLGRAGGSGSDRRKGCAENCASAARQRCWCAKRRGTRA